jgi:hypothetical protein
MSAVLREHELLVPDSLEWNWTVYGSGGTGLVTRMALQGPMDDEDVPRRIARSRPVGFPEASVGSVLVVGSGTWIDATGEKRGEHRLVELTVAPDAPGIWVELALHHDVWGPFDFRGAPPWAPPPSPASRPTSAPPRGTASGPRTSSTAGARI